MENNWVPLYGYEDKIMVKSGYNSVLYLNWYGTGKQKEVTPSINTSGHLYFGFQVDGKHIVKGLHVAIYESYNKTTVPNGYVIHHIDGNPENNELSNLLMMSDSSHKRMHRNEKPLMHIAQKVATELHKKPVIQYTMDDAFVCEYESAKDAEIRTSIDNSSISKCCKGKAKSAGGYKWYFK